ncbi:DAK2 domain-containing protein [Mycobacterium sp.]|uniref:DAK2 domain-containing protein n=1 Tax=Mycobacterium sp. TaxID=1785 RepID=UPI003A85FC5B
MLFTMRSAVAEADVAVEAGVAGSADTAGALGSAGATDTAGAAGSAGAADTAGLAGPAGVAGIAGVASALSEGARNGARGNSGIILSQILRGIADAAADAAPDAPADPAADAAADAAADRTADAAAPPDGPPGAMDTATLSAALWRGVDLVVTAMGGEEVPGTIVSVLRAAAGAVRECAAGGETLGRAVAAAADAAVVALEKTPEQLDVLADAGVVDAGGRGLLVLLDSLCSTITGHAPARPAYRPAPKTGKPVSAACAPGPRFEVMYQVDDCTASAGEALRAGLEELGDSVGLAAASSTGYSVHVHTDDAGAAIEAGIAAGRLSRIVVSPLSSGATGLPPGSWSRERAVVAVVDGDGAAELFAGEGALVLRPRSEAMDPGDGVSADELVRAVVDTGAAQVMVLPNGYVTAEELVAGCTAAIGWGVDVVPVPSGSMVQGLAALAVHDPRLRAVDDGYGMAHAAGAARCGSVRVATHDALTWAGTCRSGDGLGIAGGEVLIVAEDAPAAAIGLLDLLMASGGELITVLTGAELDAEAAEAVEDVLAAHTHDRHPGSELVVYHTGHRGDVLLIGVE